MRPDKTRLPKGVARDGVKWMILPSKVILSSLSVWPEGQNRFTALVHVIIVSCYILATTGQIFYMIDKDVDLVSRAYAISFFILSIETTVRRLVCYFYRKQLVEVLSSVYQQFWPAALAGEDVERELTRESWTFLLYCASYTVVATLWGLQVNAISLFHGNLPLRTKQPFNWHKDLWYSALYVLECVLSLEIAFNVCGLDIFFVSLTANCAAQFKLLRAHLKRTFERIMEQEVEGGPSRVASDMNDVLVTCIKQHNNLVSVCREIEQIFTFFILVQYLASIGTVCLSSFVATVVPEEVVTALTLLTGHVCEIFIYCYMGENLIIESTQLSRAVFECGWHLRETDINLRKSLVLVMARSQKPVKMSAGGFGYLSLSSFMRLIQFSFSVYTLLNKMESKRKLA